MLRNLLSAIFVLVVIVPLCFGQKTNQSKYVVKESFPSIHITFVEKGERLNFDNEKESIVRFRFHNNTIWKIVLNASSGIGDNDVRLFYHILDKDGNIIENKYCHVCSIIRLSSGNSILFSVPTKYFKNSDSMRIKYNYEWEDSPFSSPEKEPVHYVYFETPKLLKQ